MMFPCAVILLVASLKAAFADTAAALLTHEQAEAFGQAALDELNHSHNSGLGSKLRALFGVAGPERRLLCQDSNSQLCGVSWTTAQCSVPGA
eukprot:8741-Heterococcus_DN1.PRE.1